MPGVHQKIACWLSLALSAGLLLVGCAAPPLVEYQPGRASCVRAAPMNGMFTLQSESGNVESTTLSAGDPIGFARQGQQLLAVRGSQTIPLHEGKYAWLMESGGKPARPPLLPATATPPAGVTQGGQSNWDNAVILAYDVFLGTWNTLARRYAQGN